MGVLKFVHKILFLLIGKLRVKLKISEKSLSFEERVGLGVYLSNLSSFLFFAQFRNRSGSPQQLR
jgi:hypothetical protein